jgi:hypothetical protein
MVAAATNGLGVALAPAAMFMRELTAERLAHRLTSQSMQGVTG